MEEEKSVKLKKIIALATLIVTAAILCLTFYLLDKDLSTERLPVDAESGPSLPSTEPSTFPATGETTYPKASVKDKFGLLSLQSLGGINADRAEKLLVCGERVIAVGVTSSSDGDFAADNENVFVAVLDSDLNVLNCVTLKEDANVVYQDAAVSSAGITVLCTVRSGSIFYKLDLDLNSRIKTELSYFFNRLKIGGDGSIYAFADGKSISILRLDAELAIKSKQFASLPESGSIMEILPPDGEQVDIIAATASAAYLINSDSVKCDVKRLPVEKAARFYKYERNGEPFYAFVGGSELRVLDSEMNLYNRAEIGDAEYLVGSGNFLIGISPTSSSKWLCACGCSVLAEEALGVNVSSVVAEAVMPYGKVSIARTQSPQKPKTFSVLKFEGMKTEIFTYASSDLSDVVVKDAANVGGSLLIMAETSASTAEFASNKGSKDVFFLKLKNPFE